MASLVQDFIQDPSESLLDQCTKEQLLRIAQHYKVDIPDKKLKESVKAGLKYGLVEAGATKRVVTITTKAAIRVRKAVA